MLQKLILILIAIPWMGFAEVNTDKNAIRLEKLLIWKLTDELELSSKEEIAFTNLIKNLGQERRTLQSENEFISAKLKASPDSLVEYKKNLEMLSLNSMKEVSEVEKLLGKEKAARYVYLKSEILKRITAEVSKMNEAGKIPASKK